MACITVDSSWGSAAKSCEEPVGADGVLPSIDEDVGLLNADLDPPRHVNELSIAVTRSSSRRFFMGDSPAQYRFS